MKKILFLLTLLSFIAETNAQNKDYPYKPIPFTEVKLTDEFWSHRLEVNRTATIPLAFKKSEETGRVKNFIQAANHEGKFCTQYPFDDTDIYKTIEGASYSLSLHPDKKLEMYLDSMITIVGNAQEPDGYLYTARTMNSTHAWMGKARWEKEHELSHELYNSGHLFEAAVAHFQATRKRSLLNIAIRNADLLDQVFGEGKLSVAPGHEIVEMGLAKLYRATGNVKYLNLARFFIDARGKRKYAKTSKESDNVWETGEYWQDHKPVIEQTEATGHAVRAVYLYSGMADVAALTDNQAYVNAINKIWENAVGKKTYLTGGIGTAGDGERFGKNYDLPNESAYCETCAAIGSVYWNLRMFSFHGDAKYFDVLERTLYNGLIAGIGLDGLSFYYTNPLEMNMRAGTISGENKRSPWFGCSCCPTNISRLIPSVPGYIYAQKGNSLYLNLFISSSTLFQLDAKNSVSISQQSNYPWDGNIKINVEPLKNASFKVYVRIPGWAKNEPFPSDLYTYSDGKKPEISLKINGQKVDYQLENGYAVLNREWKKKDLIELNLPMEIRKVKANENVKDDIGKIALERGPLVYCAEFPDNSGLTGNLLLPENVNLNAEFRPDLLNGVMTLKGSVKAVIISEDKQSVSTRTQDFLAIPYFARSNRGVGEMKVWFPTKIINIDLRSE